MNSDHLPILIFLHGSFDSNPPKPPRHTYINLRKADWVTFRNETEAFFAQLEPPSSCGVGDTQFCRILLSVALHHVPKGHIPNFIPNLADSTKKLIRQRDTIRSTNPTDPQIQILDQQISRDTAESNRRKWIETVETCSHKYNASQFWNIINSLKAKRPPSIPNQPITFNQTTLSTPRAIAINNSPQ